MKVITSKGLTIRMIASIVVIVILAACLCITSFVLIQATISSRGNIFSTGQVKINLNGGKTIICEDELLFESGTKVEKDFYIENQSSCGVWYRLYFDNVKGNLGEVLEVQIQDEDTILSSGKMFELTRDKVSAFNQPLESGEKKDLTISFLLPEDAGNEVKNQVLIFDFGADAVQTRNNPDKKFE